MKIVLLPGVGYHTDTSKQQTFLDKVTEDIDCEAEVFNWMHGQHLGDHTDHHIVENLKCTHLRSWITEVLLDFQHVLVNIDKIEIPEADIYMGHSAGSLIALSKKKPCIIFGSPAHLIEDYHYSESKAIPNRVDEDAKVLNIYHDHDVLSYPYHKPHTENFKIKFSIFSTVKYLPLIGPIAAHTSYWKNKKVIDKINSTLKEWKKKA